MELDEYQRRAGTSNALADADEARAVNAALFGLASETGTLLDIQKKLLTDNLDPATSDEQFKQELGDLLWYVSRVANAKGVSLEEIAASNLRRVHDMWEDDNSKEAVAGLPVYDRDAVDTERFPRRLRFEFTQQAISVAGQERQAAQIRLVAAEPNPFRDGVIERGEGKIQGFALPFQLDPLTDNSRRLDAYRFHDAIHIAFMAHLNWSATMRSLLNLKRKSDETKDEFEDSARPVLLEEGLVAVLAGLAPRRRDFRAPSNVDGDILAVARHCTEGFEVDGVPGWLWRRAIVNGFEVLRQLDEHNGGVLVADLDAREVSFRPFDLVVS